jgi:glycosyltransferase involved in cell wall biosynthesis
MDLSVLTSLSEGLSIALLESMRHGLPVVATRVGGNPELVLDGECGYLVPARDVEAFASRVIQLLRNPEERQRIGAAARRRVEEHFSLARTAEQTQSLYESITGRGPRKSTRIQSR